MKPCPTPPDKVTLIKFVQKYARSVNKPLGIDEKHSPDKAWLVTFLATYVPDCKIFEKGYVAPSRAQTVEDETKVGLPADFMAGLPISKRKVKQRRLKMISKNKAEGKLNRLKLVQEKFKKEYLKQKNKIDA